MKKATVYCLFLTTFFHLSPGQNTASFPKSLHENIFSIYQKNQPEFYGVFDSLESIFVVHQETAIQSQFDSNCLLGSGKAWHRGQLTTFTTYLTVDTVAQVFASEDTGENATTFWGLELPELKSEGTSLWKCEGEFSMNENIAEKFSGKFMGTFTIYFLYSPKNKSLKALPEKAGFGQEPGYSFNGFWKPYGKTQGQSISFFFANTRPQIGDDGSQKLPDLRFQQDGTSSFSNIVTFPAGVMAPAANWFQ